jgi:aminopeptidase N
MKTDTPPTISLKDYRAPDFLIDDVFLDVTLGEDETEIKARLKMRRNPAANSPGAPLVMDGENLKTVGITLDGKPLGDTDYTIANNKLRIDGAPGQFTLETIVLIRPQDNTTLEGLYRSDGVFCSQCEAEGFRGITWYLDRPDVLARFKTRITGEKSRYPVMLSNGNCIESGELNDGRHFALWEDPFPKPCYLFALVAGDLGCVEDTFTTSSGRAVTLQIFVEHGRESRALFAMESLKNAMAWDERVFGLEYDLDIYMIVAVSAFNMGAMENKGLNLFNDKFVLADAETATDTDYAMIEGVIAHEYFHNWTGNRVTCRDWFQLSLKEGLTVFRDQQFSADMRSPAVQRISDVRSLRARQFLEDNGPLAHPVRPDSYIEINNFYTATVYEKGAEVIRMMHTLLGADGFRKGMDLYFERHDGAAVTCDDFVKAMEDANGADLAQFRLWYSQAGTPAVIASGNYDAEKSSFTLTLSQRTPDTPGQTNKAPAYIPIAMGLLDGDGDEIPLGPDGETSKVLHLTKPEQSFTFANMSAAPTPSLLRGFSAPIRLDYKDQDAGALAFLMAHDSDDFNRWEAAQTFAKLIAQEILKKDDADPARIEDFIDEFSDALGRALDDTQADPALIGEMLALPSESDLAEQQDIIDVDAIHNARQRIRIGVAKGLSEQLIDAYERCTLLEPYHHGPAQSAKRRLRNIALGYLTTLGGDEAYGLAQAQFQDATNMTDSIGALSALNDAATPTRQNSLDAFYARWRGDSLVTDKWFVLQATSALPDTLSRVEALMNHEAFSIKTPNRVRSLIGAFASANQLRFHAKDGAGYAFLADQIITLNTINPQIAARLVTPFTRWRRFDNVQQKQMQTALERILESPDLSRDVLEMASKTLKAE